MATPSLPRSPARARPLEGRAGRGKGRNGRAHIRSSQGDRERVSARFTVSSLRAPHPLRMVRARGQVSVFDRPLERQDALMTDLYQLTMAAAYFENGIEHSSTFELFTRRLEAGRGYLVACGLELCLDHLEGLRFTGEQISYLRHLHAFESISPRFFERLRDFRFTGDVWAVPEGTPFFPDEPILRISGPALEAQLVETYLLSIVNFETLIATKATRVLRAARRKHVSDFGTRRAHGPEAGQLVARAAFVGGVQSTSNVEAGRRLGI